MRRDILLLTAMIDAAEQAHQLAARVVPGQLESDRQRRDALLWNFTVLGEAAAQLSDETKARFPEVGWQQPVRLRNRIVHGYWSIDPEVLHTTATEQLPAFAAELRTILTTMTEDT
ncbi:MAG TPA: HepT-like ribonuclease domain-containing protein [Acidothermaceae bacterium]|nr:HepT-like ribonuclease domain-containing protein [Acidothermaceae bacterium]